MQEALVLTDVAKSNGNSFNLDPLGRARKTEPGIVTGDFTAKVMGS